MSDKLSRERLEEALAECAVDNPAASDDLGAHIAALEAENARLRAAGRDVLDMLPYHGLLDLPELRAALEVGE